MYNKLANNAVQIIIVVKHTQLINIIIKVYSICICLRYTLFLYGLDKS